MAPPGVLKTVVPKYRHQPGGDPHPPRKVLVVDDDQGVREWLQLHLEAQGYRVIQAESGSDALIKVAANRPDLILMDLLMPGIDGFEATRRLKQNRGTSPLPVILITSLEDRDARLQGLEAGAEDFLNKPLDPTELLVRVRNLLRVKAYGDLLQERNRTLEEEVHAKTLEVRQQCIETVLTLTRAAEYRDEVTGTHVSRISHYTVELAGAMGLADRFRDEIYYASPMHDIGKLAIPDDVLLKPGPLDAAQWEVMKRHTVLGREILSDARSPYLAMGGDIALYHHECWDGSGYPLGLKADEIPLAARLMAIADVYDALRSERPYKSAMEHEPAVAVILEGDGRTRPGQFDPDVLAAFRQVADRLAGIYSECR